MVWGDLFVLFCFKQVAEGKDLKKTNALLYLIFAKAP